MTIKMTGAHHLYVHLQSEYQTLRRLPRSSRILFTIRTYIDPLPSLEFDPKGAVSLADAVERINPELAKYKSLDDPTKRRVLVEKLLGLAGWLGMFYRVARNSEYSRLRFVQWVWGGKE